MPFPAGHDATGVVKPGKEAFDLPAPPRAASGPAVLRARFAVRVMPRDHLNSVGRPQVRIEPITVIPPIADQSRGERVEERGRERGVNERDFMRRSAGHVDGDRKTMAVANRHDFAALTAASRADGGAPFFAS